MRTGKRRQLGRVVVWLTIIVVVGAFGGWLYHAIQQASPSIALISALERKDIPAALAALNAGADPNATERQKATSFWEMLRKMFDRQEQPTTLTKNRNRTALYLATDPLLHVGKQLRPEYEPGNVQLIEALLKKGAKVNVRDKYDGGTALTNAAFVGSEPAVRLLLKYGADVHAKDDNGRTALNFAAMVGDVESEKALLAAGADVNSRDKWGGTPLMGAAAAVFQQPVNQVEVLIDAGADVNARDENSKTTALLCAVQSGRVEYVKDLLDAGADVHVKDVMGATPMSLAIKRRNPQIIALLKKAGAK